MDGNPRVYRAPSSDYQADAEIAKDSRAAEGDIVKVTLGSAGFFSFGLDGRQASDFSTTSHNHVTDAVTIGSLELRREPDKRFQIGWAK